MSVDPQAIADTQSEQAIAAKANSGGLIDADIKGVPLDQRVVHGEFLRALLLGGAMADGGKEPVVVSSSLRISKAWVVGKLDLSECGASARLPHITFVDCLFMDGIDLRAAILGGLQVKRGLVLGSGLQANGAHFSGAVEVSHTWFGPRGMLNFAQSHIEGNCTIMDLAVAACEPSLQSLSERLSEELTPQNPAHSGQMLDELLGRPKLGIVGSQNIQNVLGLSRIVFKSAHVSGDVSIKGTSICVAKDSVGETQSDNDYHPDAAIDARGADIEGSFLIERSESSIAVLNGSFLLCNAQIGTELKVSGTVISRHTQTKNVDALDAERATIHGSFYVENIHGSRSEIIGGLRLLGTTIDGQVGLRGVLIGPTESGNAITADGVIIKSDFFIRPSDHLEFASEITGTLRLPGAEVWGQFGILGTNLSIAEGGRYAVRARDAKFKGGVFLRPFKGVGTVVTGEVYFQDVTIDGVFQVIGTNIHGGATGAAIHAEGARIKGDLWIAYRDPDGNSSEPGDEGCWMEGTIRLAGATIGGRLRVLGATIQSAEQDEAILASGAVITGGVFLDPIESRFSGNTMYCRITGALRFNLARLGSNFQLRGVTISSPKSGVAVVAIGAEFGRDFFLRADEGGHACDVTGEIRLWGATIRGELKIHGAKLTASSTGFALDAYNSDIAMGVFLGAAPVEGSAQEICLEAKGILGFAYAQLACLTVGEARAVAVDQPLAIDIKGQLRLTGVNVVDVTAIERTRLVPPRELEQKLHDQVMNTLRRWHVSDDCMILGAEHANLGSRLYLRLHSETRGAIDLYSAKVGTLSDGDIDSWGGKPEGPAWYQAQSQEDLKGVKLGLTGFTYVHLHELEKLPQGVGWRERFKKARKSLCDATAIPSAGDRVSAAWKELRDVRHWRLEWLDRQFPDGRKEGKFVSLPYIQLASVFRAHGYLKEANEISFKRRKYQTRHGTDHWLDHLLQVGYGCFGYSYRSRRALAVLVFLFVLNILFVYAGTRHSLGWSLGLVGNHQAQDAQDWLKQASDSKTGSDSDPSVCRTPWTYALNQSFPVLHLTSDKSCTMAANTSAWCRAWHNVMLILCWIALPTALLTFSGILREETK